MDGKNGKAKVTTVIGSNHMKMLDVEKPVIVEPDQVLVRVHAAGIRGPDVYVAHGSNPYTVYPRVIGYEVTGEVEAARTAVKDIKVGDGVVSEPVTYCGRCYAHRNGHHNVCRDLKVLGCIAGGTLREYIVVRRSRVYQYDKRKISYIQAALCESCTIGSRASWRGSARPGGVVLVRRMGPIGLIVADVVKSRGAVMIVPESGKNRLIMVVRFGADHMINPMKEDLNVLTMEVAREERVNVVFETAGIPALLEHVIKILSPAGRLVAMTFGQTPITIDFKAVNTKEFTILETRHQMERFPEVLEQLPSCPDRVDRLMTHVFPAEKYEEAFAVLANKSNGTGKMVLTPD